MGEKGDQGTDEEGNSRRGTTGDFWLQENPTVQCALVFLDRYLIHDEQTTPISWQIQTRYMYFSCRIFLRSEQKPKVVLLHVHSHQSNNHITSQNPSDVITLHSFGMGPPKWIICKFQHTNSIIYRYQIDILIYRYNIKLAIHSSLFCTYPVWYNLQESVSSFQELDITCRIFRALRLFWIK